MLWFWKALPITQYILKETLRNSPPNYLKGTTIGLISQLEYYAAGSRLYIFWKCVEWKIPLPTFTKLFITLSCSSGSLVCVLCHMLSCVLASTHYIPAWGVVRSSAELDRSWCFVAQDSSYDCYAPVFHYSAENSTRLFPVSLFSKWKFRRLVLLFLGRRCVGWYSGKRFWCQCQCFKIIASISICAVFR